MKNRKIEVRCGNVTVKVYTISKVRNGQTYVSYAVSDYSEGQRKLWTFSDLGKAKEKAKEVAVAIATGKTDVLNWEEGLHAELRKALEAVGPTGVTILPACQLFAQAVRILGNHNDLLAACQHWQQHRPDHPVTPKPIKDAVNEFLQGRIKHISPRRHHTETSYLKSFVRGFESKSLHEIEAADLTDFVNGQKWGPKTRNDFLSSISLLFKEAQLRNWAGKGQNPAKLVKRLKEVRGPIEIFEPWEARQMLSRLSMSAPELVPFVALWCFAGVRKEEVSRMTWPQINRALTTGYVELRGKDTKTGEPRTVPVMDNLKAWLTLYRKESGGVLPSFWLTPTKSVENRLNEITRFITRKTGVAWKGNAPRHSFGTYYFKHCKDAGEVTAAMGTSLEKFQKHYWNKARTVTEGAAKEWFNIFPEGRDNLVPMTPKAVNPTTAAAFVSDQVGAAAIVVNR